MEAEKPQIEPVQETTHADENGSERKAGDTDLSPVVQPLDADGAEPPPAESYDKTDRKQDATLQSIAEQTEWEAKQTGLMEKQTVWIKRQAIWTIGLTAATLVVLIFHGWMMRGQLQATNETVDVMKGQLKSMESSSAQTQEMINATQRMADASQSTAERNKDLVEISGKQADASQTQADAAKQTADATATTAELTQRSAEINLSGMRPRIEIRVIPGENWIDVIFSNVGVSDARVEAKYEARATGLVNFTGGGNLEPFIVNGNGSETKRVPDVPHPSYGGVPGQTRVTFKVTGSFTWLGGSKPQPINFCRTYSAENPRIPGFNQPCVETNQR